MIGVGTPGKIGFAKLSHQMEKTNADHQTLSYLDEEDRAIASERTSNARAKPIRVITEVGFKDGFNHQLTSLLHHLVTNRRYSQRPLSAIRFRDVDP
jgi:hypothetical protein